LSALAALGTLVFTIVLVRVTSRQVSIAAEQSRIAARQAQIMEAQHALLVEQDARARPRLALGIINDPQWIGDEPKLSVIFEVANTGGREVAPHTVLLNFTEKDNTIHSFVGRVVERRSPGDGFMLKPGEAGTFLAHVPLYDYFAEQGTVETITMQVFPFGEGPSEPAPVPNGDWIPLAV
jgi:hypothetical protein